MLLKKDLRTEYKQMRSELSLKDKLIAQQKIGQYLKLLLFNNSICHIFLPIKKQNEIDTIALIELLNKSSLNIEFCTSICNFDDYSMPCYKIDLNNLENNKLGIPEPKKPLTSVNENTINTVIIPLLAADKNGNRVGYGKGFYDRFLAKLPTNTLKIGVNYFDVINNEIEKNDNDIALNMHISPNGITSFK